ncbi:transporter substrate-binding domain-containing protein [Alkalimonas collagenimarina]|uniref:Transporter substrate-binding domain-containing protein n=1 Tax=Alkalimonas collagenimarina TaxID=400390 RepID=A0ABT9H158_9GAMM|nr:transporter substrate-binding domain-containing protein [Alkalimonas collagenimarina]MDP4537030.1 transporter substrate-binding domain-containing protein [Alkalimonas collagenimarina]
MMISNAFRLTLCFCMLWLPHAQAEPADITFYTEHLPPYSYVENGEVIGINVELVEGLCQRLELSCSISLLPWRRAFSLAQQQPLSGVFSTSRTDERESMFQWVGPIASDWGYLFRLKGRTDVNPTNLEEAKAFKLAIARGDVYESYFQRHGFEYGVNLLDFATKPESIPLFIAKRVDLLVGSPRSVRSWMLHHGEPEDSAEALFKLRDVGDNYLALHPSFPAELTARLQQELDLLREQGVIQALIEQYTHQ